MQILRHTFRMRNGFIKVIDKHVDRLPTEVPTVIHLPQYRPIASDDLESVRYEEPNDLRFVRRDVVDIREIIFEES